MTTLRALVLLGALLSGPASAQDFVISSGPLGDADFYRLVTCGRPPGGTCRTRPRRWPEDLAHNLAVSRLAEVDPVSKAVSAQVDAALVQAIDQINGVGAGVRLHRTPDNTPAPIRLSIRSPATIALIARGHDPDGTLPSGMALLPRVPADRITDATILISSAIPLTEIRSVVLEELIQSLGLVYDIENPAYTRRSIFAQSASGVTLLAGQDAVALQLHYPPLIQAKTYP